MAFFVKQCSMQSGVKNTVVGFAAGIASGVAYGLNPLFGKPLLEAGVSVPSMLFFRYFISLAIIVVWMFIKQERFRLQGVQYVWMLVLGILFGCSSIFLIESYHYIPSGLATTLVYTYPIFIPLILLFLRERAGWSTWVSVGVTVAGVFVMCTPSGNVVLNWVGVILAVLSALSYSFYLVIVNKTKRIGDVSAHAITFYALAVGALLFLGAQCVRGEGLMEGIVGWQCWLNLLGLAIFPTTISLLMLAVSTRLIGATRTAILGSFEPITAIAIGVAAFGEPLTIPIVVGVLLCIGAILFMVVGNKEHKESETNVETR